jgi:RraA family protein
MDANLRDLLLGVDCAALADAQKSIRVIDGAIRPVGSASRLVGPARTVRCHEDFLTVIKGLAEAEPGEVLVIDTQGSTRAVLGELFSLEARRRGLAGIVVDGPVRDLRTLRELDLPVHARSACPCAGTTRDLRETQVPVVCGGVVVNPGDIVLGDQDGLLVASEAELRALLPTAQETERKEAQVRARIAAGESLLALINYEEHAAALARGEASRLMFRLGD